MPSDLIRLSVGIDDAEDLIRDIGARSRKADPRCCCVQGLDRELIYKNGIKRPKKDYRSPFRPPHPRLRHRADGSRPSF